MPILFTGGGNKKKKKKKKKIKFFFLLPIFGQFSAEFLILYQFREVGGGGSVIQAIKKKRPYQLTIYKCTEHFFMELELNKTLLFCIV